MSLLEDVGLFQIKMLKQVYLRREKELQKIKMAAIFIKLRPALYVCMALCVAQP
jgi:hypothetical protein